ncbi:hypothetical protein [Orrella marina]|uniref:Uncharacterized protein n=1 Tax=Orrella marina TaxID=2163011 RepID=A0A2R4XF03_9BURK|nr:hypothetical protein [Orrella marina]AWB32392.1 hypothetical protein DBV39_00215 [Orrella marina]
MVSIKAGVIALALTAATAAGAAWTAQGWRYEARIADIRREQSDLQSDLAKQAIDSLQSDITRIATAASQAAEVAPTLTRQVGQLSRALKDATPLPAGCSPDLVRLRNLTDAVRATNTAATGSQSR